MFARKTAEAVCKILYVDKISEHIPPPTALEKLLEKLKHEKHLSKQLELQLRTIQTHGNFGSHDQGDDSDEISAEYVEPCVKSLDFVVKWLLEKHLPADYQTKKHHQGAKSVTNRLLKSVPDATLRFLLSISPSVSVDDVRAAFEAFAVGRTGDWRRLWNEFEGQWNRKKSVPPTNHAKTRSLLDELRNLKPRAATGKS